MTVQSDIFRGAWRFLPNQAEHVKGTIHDDHEARSRGFRRGIVGGPAVAQAIIPGVADRLGAKWIEGGWLSVKFVGPVYADEEVREVAESTSDSDVIRVKIEARNGRVALVGEAGLGHEEPWRAEEDGRRGADEGFPCLDIGFTFPDLHFKIDEDAALRLCEAAGDETPWFRGPTRWGGPVVPPIAVFNPATESQRVMALDHPVDQAGLNAEFMLLATRPMLRDQSYVLRMTIVDKGVGARTWFCTTQFEVLDTEGNRFLTARQKCKWFSKVNC